MFGGFATNVKTTGYELTGDLGKCLRMGGLTFYKDFTKSGDLDADFALGSRKATYTSTSGTPTLNANGYAATTANDDVLKYEIANNRTAAQETIVIKFTPSSDFANDGVSRFLTGTITKRRSIRKPSTGISLSSYANEDDYNLAAVNWSTNFLQNISYVCAVTMQQTGNPNMISYMNSSIEGTDNDDYTGINWGTNFFIGSDHTGALQFNGSIAWIKIFNRALTAAEVALIV